MRLNAIFGPLYPPRGRVGFLSQSGALGLAIIDYARKLELGLSSFVSVGNKADISGNDLIQYWEADDNTDVILLYLESFGNPRKFGRIARRIGKRKPILAVKSGRSAAGARASSSHTGALVAASDVTVDSLFEQAGVIRTDTLSELFDVASLLSSQPVPRGKRVAIVTNAGGPGIMCADACEALGLEVVALRDEVRAELATFLPSEAALTNPVDMIATAPAEHYRRTVAVIGRHEAADAIIAIFIPPLLTKPSRGGARDPRGNHGGRDDRSRAGSLHDRRRSAGRPRRGRTSRSRRTRSPRTPRGRSPAQRTTACGEARPRVRFAPSTTRAPEEAAAVIAPALKRRPALARAARTSRACCPATGSRCRKRRSSTPRTRRAPRQRDSAASRAQGGRADAPPQERRGRRRSRLSRTRAMSTAAAERMADRVKQAGHELRGFLVQQMAPAGVEMLVGVVHDALFGPVVACGAGGVTAELLKDVAVRITPLTDRDAAQMVTSLRTFPLLDGFRGAPKADIDSLEQVLLRVGALVENHPEIAEMDCNPVIVSPEGALVVDARVRVEEAAPPRPEPALRA